MFFTQRLFDAINCRFIMVFSFLDDSSTALEKIVSVHQHKSINVLIFMSFVKFRVSEIGQVNSKH